MAVRRIWVNGRWVWQARVAFRGRRTSALCPTRPDARQAEATLLQRLQSQDVEAQQDATAPATVKGLFEGYVADLEARGKGPETIGRAAQTARVVEQVLPDLLDLPVHETTAEHLFAFRRLRDRAGTKPSTINRDLRTIRAMFRRVRPEFVWPRGLLLPEEELRVRWLRPDEELLLIEALPRPFREIARLAALTLMRLGEVRTLRREQVYLDQGVVQLPRAKAGPRPVILSAEAQKLLRHVLEGHAGPWVFPGPRDCPYTRMHISHVFRRAARAVGLHDFHFHDLRHHGATRALNAGFSVPILMALGGWKTERMVRRYAAVTDPTLRAAADAVAGHEPTRLGGGTDRRGVAVAYSSHVAHHS